MTDKEFEKMQKELKDSFRQLAKKHGVVGKKAEKFVGEIIDVLKRGPEIPSAEERDKAVKKVLKKYGIEVEMPKTTDGKC